MSHKRMKCFVAMAFGRNDCDLVYRYKILPTLRALKLTPIRVDRRQHRDDLNNFIIRMLKASNIVIADLTYARPSVYYEAGFAERASPIIYTVRSDHLTEVQPDDRLRVHFDLKMKKIVDWKSPEDQKFASRLRARIAYLLKPIVADNAEKERVATEKRLFSQRSVKDRCECISRLFAGELRKKRLWLRRLVDINLITQWEIDPATVLVGAKMIGRRAVSATLLIAESITRKQIRTALHSATGTALIDGSQSDVIYQYDEHIYFCALSRIPASRLTTSFPRVTPDKDRPDCFCLSHTIDTFKNKKKCKKTIWLVGPIESEWMAKESARDIVCRLSGKKTNTYTAIAMDRYSNQGQIVFERTRKP